MLFCLRYFTTVQPCLGCGSELNVLVMLASRASLNNSFQLQFVFSFTLLLKTKFYS